MTDEKKVKKVAKKYTALKKILNSNGKVKKGEEFTCNDKELAIFKKVKAV